MNRYFGEIPPTNKQTGADENITSLSDGINDFSIQKTVSVLILERLLTVTRNYTTFLQFFSLVKSISSVITRRVKWIIFMPHC